MCRRSKGEFGGTVCSPPDGHSLRCCPHRYLEKKGKMMSGWQKRWFVSSGHYLTYYKNEQKKELLCSIDLEQVDVIQPNGMATHGMFQIQVKGGKLMNLRAPTGMEAVAWCDDLQTFSDHHAQTVDEIRDELRAYYQSRNPAKVDEVDAIMAQFEGREMEVVTMLQQAKLAEAQAAQAAGGGGPSAAGAPTAPARPSCSRGWPAGSGTPASCAHAPPP